ncbi:hypothetical protein [Hafnia alvei]|uniref:hypothetical protein n=1 Tax=Hafnia alvei TaxID=569 RepID=UPI00345CC2F5
MFILKISWVSISIVVLSITLYFYDGTNNSDIEIFLSYSMLVLSFPSGLIVSAFLSGAIYLIALMVDGDLNGLEVNYFYLVIEWGILFFVGYIQWFYVIPILYRKLQKSNSSNQ